MTQRSPTLIWKKVGTENPNEVYLDRVDDY